MIRPTDAFVLAYTKLRTHKVRTGITVGISGIMFGLIFAMIFIVQGVVDSVDRFSKEGLADRAIVMVSSIDASSQQYFDLLEDKKFISEVESIHDKTVDKKESAAAKYDIYYDADSQDPSPVVTDPKTKKKSIPDENLDNPFIKKAMDQRLAKDNPDKFDINKYLEPYKSAKILPNYYEVRPASGSLTYMKDGKESLKQNQQREYNYDDQGNISAFTPTVMSEEVTEPFISDKNFDPQKGEIPVILPYSQATKLLGMKPLDKNATSKRKLDRLQEVRSRISDVKIDFCYRNSASEQLISTAKEQVAQKELLKKSSQQIEYKEIGLQYKLPNEPSCGPVKIAKDLRSAEEKQQDKNQENYEKAIGEYIGKPVQQKITFRGVGIVGEMSMDGLTGIGDMVSYIFGSNLGWNSLPIPADLLAKVPAEYRQTDLFRIDESGKFMLGDTDIVQWTNLVEFTDKEDARALLKKTGALPGGSPASNQRVYASQFGSNSLLTDELEKMFAKVVLWTLVLVGGIAMIILGSMIGRTVSEGRRESAVFRAIGAKRIDIASIYSSYAFLLSLRIALFSLVLGIVVAGTLDILYGEDATIAAKLSYAAHDTTEKFHLISVMSWYVLAVIAAIIVASLLAAAIPIIRSVRRNPINDMRDE